MKVCKKCNLKKELDMFGFHKNNADNHLNTCKKCTSDYNKKSREEKSKDPKYMEKERQRKKANRGNWKNGRLTSTEMSRRTISKYPEKKACANLIVLFKRKKGHQLHHWSYNIEHAKDVIELSISEHNKLHRYLIYDKNCFMYRRKDNGELLDTKEKHVSFYESLSNLY